MSRVNKNLILPFLLACFHLTMGHLPIAANKSIRISLATRKESLTEVEALVWPWLWNWKVASFPDRRLTRPPRRGWSRWRGRRGQSGSCRCCLTCRKRQLFPWKVHLEVCEVYKWILSFSFIQNSLSSGLFFPISWIKSQDSYFPIWKFIYSVIAVSVHSQRQNKITKNKFYRAVTLAPIVNWRGILSGKSLKFVTSPCLRCCNIRIFWRFRLNSALSSAKNAAEQRRGFPIIRRILLHSHWSWK